MICLVTLPFASASTSLSPVRSLMIRPAYVHPSGLSPTEHEAYSLWIAELEAQVAKLDRGLRFGEMLAFIRRRTPVERENEVCFDLEHDMRAQITLKLKHKCESLISRSCTISDQCRSSRAWVFASS